jgi:hypothetical protein
MPVLPGQTVTTVDALAVERFASPAALLHERVLRCQVKVANCGELCGRPAGHAGQHWQVPRRRPATGGTWEEYRDAYDRADGRLAEARRRGLADSWREEEVPDA